MSRSIVRLVAGLAMLAVPAVVEAQSCTQADAGPNTTCTVNASASLTIPTIVNLAISGAPVTVADIALAMPTFDAAFFTGGPAKYTSTVISLSRRSNDAYNVTILAAAATFTGPGTRAASTLLWSNSSSCAGTGTALDDVTPGAVVSGTAGSTTADLCFSTEFSNNLASAMMTPGAYSLGVNLTITAP